MVMARLHIICGNCGSNEHFKYHIDQWGHDFSTEDETILRPAVFIRCGNCGTIHDLMKTVDEVEKMW